MSTEKTVKPNKTRIRMWVKALRSGKYKQIVGKLRDKEGHCCLGVACDIYRKALHKTFAGRKDGDEWLPDNVALWFGLNNSNPMINGKLLTDLNDGKKVIEIKRHNFNEIASVIERKYLKKVVHA